MQPTASPKAFFQGPRDSKSSFASSPVAECFQKRHCPISSLMLTPKVKTFPCPCSTFTEQPPSHYPPFSQVPTHSELSVSTRCVANASIGFSLVLTFCRTQMLVYPKIHSLRSPRSRAPQHSYHNEMVPSSSTRCRANEGVTCSLTFIFAAHLSSPSRYFTTPYHIVRVANSNACSRGSSPQVNASPLEVTSSAMK